VKFAAENEVSGFADNCGRLHVGEKKESFFEELCFGCSDFAGRRATTGRAGGRRSLFRPAGKYARGSFFTGKSL